MTGAGRRFDGSELQPHSGPGPSTAELADALAAARELETLTALDQIGPTVGFEDRVMTAIAAEAPPRVVLRSASPGFGGRLVALMATLGDAWRVATSRHRPLFVRAQAIAFVLVFILATGSLAGVAVIGAANVLAPLTGPEPSLVPVVTDSPPTPTPVRPSPSPTPSVSPDPSPSTEPGATDDHGSETAEPTESNETKTPRAARTPKPTETPEGTDDHGGGGGHGGDDSGGDDSGSGGSGGSGGGGGGGPGPG